MPACESGAMRQRPSRCAHRHIDLNCCNSNRSLKLVQPTHPTPSHCPLAHRPHSNSKLALQTTGVQYTSTTWWGPFTMSGELAATPRDSMSGSGGGDGTNARNSEAPTPVAPPPCSRASNNDHTAGAVMVWASEVSIENVALHDNSASYAGGGVVR